MAIQTLHKEPQALGREIQSELNLQSGLTTPRKSEVKGHRLNHISKSEASSSSRQFADLGVAGFGPVFRHCLGGEDGVGIRRKAATEYRSMKAASAAFTSSIALLILGLVCGCTESKTPPSTAEVVGTYTGRYGDGIEVIDLKADGQFYQTFKKGVAVISSASGKWSDKNGVITFQPFMSPDAISSGTPDGNPDSRPRSSGEWHWSPIRIDLGEWPYSVVKSKGVGARPQ